MAENILEEKIRLGQENADLRRQLKEAQADHAKQVKELSNIIADKYNEIARQAVIAENAYRDRMTEARLVGDWKRRAEKAEAALAVSKEE